MSLSIQKHNQANLWATSGYYNQANLWTTSGYYFSDWKLNVVIKVHLESSLH